MHQNRRRGWAAPLDRLYLTQIVIPGSCIGRVEVTPSANGLIRPEFLTVVLLQFTILNEL